MWNCKGPNYFSPIHLYIKYKVLMFSQMLGELLNILSDAVFIELQLLSICLCLEKNPHPSLLMASSDLIRYGGFPEHIKNIIHSAFLA